MTISAAEVAAAIAAAEATALAQHEAGTCDESEFTCSYCEAEAEA